MVRLNTRTGKTEHQFKLRVEVVVLIDDELVIESHSVQDCMRKVKDIVSNEMNNTPPYYFNKSDVVKLADMWIATHDDEDIDLGGNGTTWSTQSPSDKYTNW